MIDLEILKRKITELHEGYHKLVKILETECWQATWEIERKRTTNILSIDDFEGKTIEEKLIPRNFFPDYRKWYSLAKGILDINGDSASIKEFENFHDSMMRMSNSHYITKEGQLNLIDTLHWQLAIVKSLPAYLEGKAYNFKLSIASTLFGDELKEARLLFEKGFIRASGALVGVILERHLKFRFDDAIPKIRYGEKATLGHLINKAKDNDLFEMSVIQKLGYLNSVRISCDHDKKKEPSENEVKDLIDQTDRFIHFMDE